jgi:large subunit ribosomal protein L9
MEVILLENIRNLGAFGSTVKVAKGYGRNFLLPQGKALPATPVNVARFEAQRAELEQKANERLAAAQARAETFDGVTLTIKARASEEGKLYGSVGTTDVVDAFTQAGHEVERQEVRLPEGGIHTIGEFDFVLVLHAEVEITIPVIVEADK